MVETIFDKIGRTNKFYVEFGFGYAGLTNDRDSFLNVKPNVGYMRLEGGWSGVLFDPVLESSFWNGNKYCCLHSLQLSKFSIKHLLSCEGHPNRSKYSPDF